MARKYFGTDGIRGLANGDKLTPELALRVGMAAGTKFVRGDHRNRVVIGKDTRRSGYMIEQALTAGFTAVGMDVYLLGPMPTPAVAMLTRSLRADLGVMISASHNPYDDNGIKLFRPDAYKLSDELELQIEKLIDSDMTRFLAKGRDIGRAQRDEEARTRYIEYAKRTLPRNIDLSGLRVVLDCANGAAYKVAPIALWELGAEVFTINLLGTEHKAVSARLARPGEHQLDGIDLIPTELGPPALADSLAVFECRLEQAVEAGDHTILIGRVLRFSRPSRSAPLVYIAGKYSALAQGRPPEGVSGRRSTDDT